MQFIINIILLPISCLAFVAGWYGLAHFFDINSHIGFFVITLVAIILINFPLLFCITATYGCISYWHLPLWIGVFIFIIPVICSIMMHGITKPFVSFSVFNRLRKK